MLTTLISSFTGEVHLHKMDGSVIDFRDLRKAKSYIKEKDIDVAIEHLFDEESFRRRVGPCVQWNANQR